MKTLTQRIKNGTGKSRLLKFALAGIAFSFVLYMFGISSATISIADADTYNQNISNLQTEIGELEIEYFEIINTLSLEQANNHGFNELSNVHYVRIDETKSVAYNL